jgi:hypothetical protein
VVAEPWDRAWLQHPSLEYRHAFDLCAAGVYHAGGLLAISRGLAVPRATALYASSPFHARELLKRLGGCDVTLVTVGGWASSFGPGPLALESLLGPEVSTAYLRIANGPGSLERSPTAAVPVAVWAEPERRKGNELLAHICDALLPGGILYVVASSWLARFLPEWQRADDRPAARPSGPCRISRWLHHQGLLIEAYFGFHGPVSLGWGYASRWARRFGRTDLADRYQVKMRASFDGMDPYEGRAAAPVHRWQARWAPIWLLLARKG